MIRFALNEFFRKPNKLQISAKEVLL